MPSSSIVLRNSGFKLLALAALVAAGSDLHAVSCREPVVTEITNASLQPPPTGPLTIVSLNMAGVTDYFFARPGFVLLVIAAAFAANAGLQVLGTLVFLPAGRRLAFTAGHMAGNCNMALVLAVLADKAQTEVVIFFALAQLPMYMLPVAAKRIYRRFL